MPIGMIPLRRRSTAPTSGAGGRTEAFNEDERNVTAGGCQVTLQLKVSNAWHICVDTASITARMGTFDNANNPAFHCREYTAAGSESIRLWYQRLHLGKDGLHQSLGLSRRNPDFFSHPHQVGYGLRTHFAHKLAAVNLDGGFSSANLAGDLLAEQAGDDPR